MRHTLPTSPRRAGQSERIRQHRRDLQALATVLGTPGEIETALEFIDQLPYSSIPTPGEARELLDWLRAHGWHRDGDCEARSL